MAPEIVEIAEINDSPHNDNTDKNDNNNNSNSDGDSNGDSTGHSNECESNGRNQCNNYAHIGENKKKDRGSATSMRSVWHALRWARSMVTTIREKNISTKEDKKDSIKSEHRNRESDAHLPDNHSQDQFQQSSFFKDFRARFEGLGSPRKKCMSSFILFPENTALKKTLLVNWWIVEGFLDDLKKEGKAIEDIATEILDELTANNFILPVIKKFPKVASSFKIDQDVHSALILLGKSTDSRSDGNIFSWLDNWACLEKSDPLELKSLRKVKTLVNVDKVKTLFNVDKGSLDFTLESFSKMKSVEFLYLGRSQSWDEHHHIDVTNSEFLKGFKNMEKLSFLSLQGISGIQELPSSISHLKNLEILDARSCYHLHKLPKEIGSLTKLTHLDISECYLLDYMPKELKLLSELQVFKGFVDSNNMDRCTLEDLQILKKLRKLSVTVNIETFPTEIFLDVYNFKQLLKLKIVWGGKLSRVMRNKNSEQRSKEVKSKGQNFNKKRSPRAQVRGVEEVRWEKLELQCLPHKTLPEWANPYKLPKLKKLYIRGGELRSLDRIQMGNTEWEVEALRLKYLDGFKMDWRKLRALFPKLQYLETFKCPKLTLFPCDCYGVWSKPMEESAPLPQTAS